VGSPAAAGLGTPELGSAPSSAVPGTAAGHRAQAPGGCWTPSPSHSSPALRQGEEQRMPEGFLGWGQGKGSAGKLGSAGKPSETSTAGAVPRSGSVLSDGRRKDPGPGRGTRYNPNPHPRPGTLPTHPEQAGRRQGAGRAQAGRRQGPLPPLHFVFLLGFGRRGQLSPLPLSPAQGGLFDPVPLPDSHGPGTTDWGRRGGQGPADARTPQTGAFLNISLDNAFHLTLLGSYWSKEGRGRWFRLFRFFSPCCVLFLSNLKEKTGVIYFFLIYFVIFL